MAQVPVINYLAEVLQVCRECPTTTATAAYISAVRRFCQKSRWLEVTIPGATIAGSKLYALGSDVNNEIIGIKSITIAETSSDTHPLTENYSGNWDANAAQDVPEFYQYVPEAQFALYPTPNAIFPLTVTVAVQPKNGSNSIEDALLVSWDECFQAGALSYLLALPRTPWTDKNEANAQDAIFRGMCNQAAMSAMRGYNAGAAVTDRNGGDSAAIRTRMLPI